jgi:hypothetical protein
MPAEVLQPGTPPSVQSVSRELRLTLLAGFAGQLLVLVFSALVLDRGVVFHASSLVAVGYWIGVLVILIRRHTNPTRFDFWSIQWGYLVLVTIAQPLAHWYWHSRGAT